KDYNDGEELDYSARKLFALYPEVRTMAVVPVGMTRYREGLTKIRDIDAEYAAGVIEQIRALNREFGVNFVQPADEFYFRAGMEVEEYDFYGQFEQIENGVGMTAKFKKEFYESLEKCENKAKMLLVCGTSAANFISDMTQVALSYIDGLSAEVVAVENKFFGTTVNCTGLLTCGDIAEAAENYGKDYDYLVMPRHVLRENTRLFLDGKTVDDLEKRLNKKVLITDGTGGGFFKTLKGEI
ncbi:MAG: DUF512 domain-containing protein, partial [Clostridia bacterium]|nr:DUF512 domain-containing protein [Clostridia bacterium]